MTQAFLMMGQKMSQVLPPNPPSSHYIPTSFHSPMTSSFSCESNYQMNPNLGESFKISEGYRVQAIVALRKWEKKKHTHTIHFNLKTSVQFSKQNCTIFTTCGRSVNNLSKIFKRIPAKGVLLLIKL